MMLVLKHWKCIDASISSEGGNQYEKQALSRRQAALKKRLSLIEDAVLEGCFCRRGFLEGIALGACVQDKTCEDRKRSRVSLYIGERHDSEGGERKQEKKNKRQRDKKTRRQSQRKQEGD